MDQNDLVYKIIIVGDSRVGKTSILKSYCYNKFDSDEQVTVGCDFKTKIIQKGKCQIKLQLWDVAGQERYTALSRLYVRGSVACLVVSDITDYVSLENSLQWKDVVNSEDSEIPLYLIQNKIDILNDIDINQLQDFQKEDNFIQFSKRNNFTSEFRISAKEKTNLKFMFNTIVDQIYQKQQAKQQKINDQQSYISAESTYQINSLTNKNKSKKKKSGSCC